MSFRTAPVPSQRQLLAMLRDGATFREMATAQRRNMSGVHKTLERLRRRMERWWAETAEEREAEREARMREQMEATTKAGAE